jgi:hypothetical protein
VHLRQAKACPTETEERRIVEDFEDDSTEPLRSICDRWKTAVEAKGRVPYDY